MIVEDVKPKIHTLADIFSFRAEPEFFLENIRRPPLHCGFTKTILVELIFSGPRCRRSGIIMLEDELQLWYLLSDCVDELREKFVVSHFERQVSEFMALTARQLQLIQIVGRLTRNNG